MDKSAAPNTASSMASSVAQKPFDGFELHPDPTALLTPEGAMLRANAAFRATFRQWIGPKRPPWGRVIPPPMKGDLRKFEAPAPDGRLFEWLERRLPDGARYITARDITAHARAGEEASRAKTTLFATLTHELRTPLNGVLGMAGLLAQTKLEPAQASYVRAIRQSGELLLDLITEILDYSRLEASNEVALEIAPFDPEAIMQDVAELLSPKAHDKGLELAVSIPRDAPLRVAGDDGRVRQILFNLAANAIKFTEEGGVVLELARLDENRFRFSVRDSGPGVPLEKQALIFEEFTQADAGIARKHGGAGLGLSIVRRLARAMGGDVGLISPPGAGATFYVDLPLKVVPGGEPIDTLEGVRIGVLSGSHVVASTLAATVRSLGATPVQRDAPCDVLLLDWRADYAADELKDLGRNAKVVIALIPQEQREIIAKCRALGVSHYTLKPVRRHSLVERVRVALGAVRANAHDDDWGLHDDDEEETPAPLHGVRVLLAEDNPINALLARTLIERQGAAVDIVHDGEEAVAAVAAAPYQLILLDLRMPRLDGFGAAQRIRALPGDASKIPIVALTADAGEEERGQAIAAGMNDFVTKPINAAHLAEVLQRFTGAAKTANVSDALRE